MAAHAVCCGSEGMGGNRQEKMVLPCVCTYRCLCGCQRGWLEEVCCAGQEGLVFNDVLTLQLSVLSAVPHVLRTSTIAFRLLYGNRDSNCRGYTATEENSGDGGGAGA